MMCTVQVLLLTDVMRRDGLPGADRQSPPRAICRRLFSDEDSSRRRAEFLDAVHEDIEKQNRERWNFDFRTDTPLPGRYRWVPVGPGLGRREESPSRDASQTSKRMRQTTTQSKITDFLLQRKRHRTMVESSPQTKLKCRRLEEQPQHAAVQ